MDKNQSRTASALDSRKFMKTEMSIEKNKGKNVDNLDSSKLKKMHETQ